MVRRSDPPLMIPVADSLARFYRGLRRRAGVVRCLFLSVAASVLVALAGFWITQIGRRSENV